MFVKRLILFVSTLMIFSLGLLSFDQSALADECKPGWYKKGGNCLQAQPGYFVKKGTTKLEQCPPGTFSETRGAVECTLCEKGRFNPRSGGYSYEHCIKAWPGNYVPTTGAKKQIKCAPGTYMEYEGQDKCRRCAVGTYTSSNEQLRCIDASIGHYVDKKGQRAQTPCPANTYRNSKNAKSLSDCKACPTNHGSLPASRDCTHITSPYLYHKFRGVGAKNTLGDDPTKCKKGKNWRTSKQKCANK